MVIWDIQTFDSKLRMATEGGEAETQQKEETKRHTYPLVRVRWISWIDHDRLQFLFVDKWYEWWNQNWMYGIMCNCMWKIFTK